MIKLITGVPGTGKTKMLISMVNEAVKTTKGSIVCVEKGIKLRFDIDYNARLINIDEYLVDNAEALFGFIAGLIASNHDITEIFIDSALKISGYDIAALEKIVLRLENLSEKTGVNIIMTSSIPKGSEPEALKKFL
jgi:broad-specificity NMP kinase